MSATRSTEGGDADLTDKVVIVTGGTKGIGAVIASRFLTAGAHVVVCGRNPPDVLPVGGHRTAVFIATDVRDPDRSAALVDATTGQFGRLDVLVNNAGGSPRAAAADSSARFTASVITLNLIAPFQLSQLAFRVMRDQQDGGQIINIGSIAGRHPAPGTAAYAAAKGGLTTMTRALAMEFAPKVRVNEVTVGLVQTELAHLHYGDQPAMDAVAATIPMQRMALPDDVAGVCLLLCSPLAGYVTGAALLVDGGGELPPRVQSSFTAGDH